MIGPIAGFILIVVFLILLFTQVLWPFIDKDKEFFSLLKKYRSSEAKTAKQRMRVATNNLKKSIDEIKEVINAVGEDKEEALRLIKSAEEIETQAKKLLKINKGVL